MKSIVENVGAEGVTLVSVRDTIAVLTNTLINIISVLLGDIRMLEVDDSITKLHENAGCGRIHKGLKPIVLRYLSVVIS